MQASEEERAPRGEAESKDPAAFVEALEILLGQLRYAVESSRVAAVCSVEGFTPLPGAPSHLLGVIDVDGEAVPLLDGRAALGLDASGEGGEEVVEVVVVHTALGDLGLRVDEVGDVSRIPASVAGSGSEAGNSHARFCRGVTAEGILLLDAEAMAAATRPVGDAVRSAASSPGASPAAMS